MAHDNFQINSAAVSDKGLSEKRPKNEDSYLELRDSGLFAVADGVGGAQAGDVASQMATEILAEAFINLQENGDAEVRMKAAIEQANSAICQMSGDLQQLSTMATTVVALHIDGNIATIGHVGDSRLYRLDSNGNFLQETQDHSVVEEEVRAGRLTPEEAANHPSRNVISRALGADTAVEIDMKTIMFEPETTFLVCTDGITRHIPDDELKQILESEDDPTEICQKFKTLCYERGAEDNLTAVVIKVLNVLEGAFANKSANFAGDFEEETKTASRSPLVNSSILSNARHNLKDSETEKNLFEEKSNDSNLNENSGNKEIVVENEIINQEIQAESNQEVQQIEKAKIETAESANVQIHNSSREATADNLTGKMISGLVWLLIGGLIGAGIGYLLFNNSQSNGNFPANQSRSEIESNTAFAQKINLVDEDPAQYIAKNVSPQTAEDFYLIGRAYLRQGNHASAKTALTNAKEKLDANSSDSTLKFEIAQGLAVVNDLFAQDVFEKEMGISKDNNPNSEANMPQINSNSEITSPDINTNNQPINAPGN